MMAEENSAGQDGDESPRKGRSNAILTYELLSNFDRKLTTLVERFEASIERQRDRDENLKDHEDRIRVLDKTLTAFISGATQGKADRSSLWLGLGTIAALMLQTLALVELFTRNHP